MWIMSEHQLTDTKTQHLPLIRSWWRVNPDGPTGAALPSLRSTSLLDTAWVSLHTNTSTPQTRTGNSSVRMESILGSPRKLFWQKASGTFPALAAALAVLPLIYPVLLSPRPDCDFEESHLCGYSNQWNANVNWFVGGGGTQHFRNDIPDDHTYNNKTGGKWMKWMNEGVIPENTLSFYKNPKSRQRLAAFSSEPLRWGWGFGLACMHGRFSGRYCFMLSLIGNCINIVPTKPSRPLSILSTRV